MESKTTPWYKSKMILSITAIISIISSIGGWGIFEWGYNKAMNHAKREVDKYVDSLVTRKLVNRSISFRQEISDELMDRGHNIPSHKVPKAFADAYIWTDSIKIFDKYLKPILTFEYQYTPVGMYVKNIDNSKWYRSPDGELYRAYIITNGEYVGYYTYVDKDGKHKYIFEN